MVIGSIVKLIIGLGFIVSGTVLLLAGKISEGGGIALITIPGALIIGNGVTALRGQPVPSILQARNVTTTVDERPVNGR